jgi:hypothetical protein
LKVFIGIDDTDNLESRGTGFRARQLGQLLNQEGLIKLLSITRHQLLVDQRIPFTSHNSSACIVGELMGTTDQTAEFCAGFLLRESAPDSDAGLCIATENLISDEIHLFGQKAKREIIDITEAVSISEKTGIFLDGYLNSRIGMIGSLAAVGLRSHGNDGRLLWLRNLRETLGIYRADEYAKLTGVELITDIDGQAVPGNATLNITDWCRPVMQGGLITLFVEKIMDHELYNYQSASKEHIKSISG